jgi:lycopene cyclase domain-containing protein
LLLQFLKTKMHFLSSPYLNWLFWFVWLPCAVLWVIYWRILIKYKPIFIKAAIAALVFSVPWDVVAYRTHIWLWPQSCCVGVHISYLPMEEYFFLIFVTIYIVTCTLIFLNHFARRPLSK